MQAIVQRENRSMKSIKGVNADRWEHRVRVNLPREAATGDAYCPSLTATPAAVAPVGVQ
jgi:hypothetical protein